MKTSYEMKLCLMKIDVSEIKARLLYQFDERLLIKSKDLKELLLSSFRLPSTPLITPYPFSSSPILPHLKFSNSNFFTVTMSFAWGPPPSGFTPQALKNKPSPKSLRPSVPSLKWCQRCLKFLARMLLSSASLGWGVMGVLGLTPHAWRFVAVL
jgi:hypothetical protein